MSTSIGVAQGLNYGLDHSRFPTAAPVGSAVAATQTIIDAEAKSGGALIKSEVVIKTIGEKRPARIAKTLILLFPGAGRL